MVKTFCIWIVVLSAFWLTSVQSVAQGIPLHQKRPNVVPIPVQTCEEKADELEALLARLNGQIRRAEELLLTVPASHVPSLRDLLRDLEEFRDQILDELLDLDCWEIDLPEDLPLYPIPDPRYGV